MLGVCEFAGRISYAFEKISDRVEQLDWYLFPRKIEHMLPLTITFTQQTVEFPCFGSTACDRDAFKKACVYTHKKIIKKIIQIKNINHINPVFSGYQHRIFILYDTTSVLNSEAIYCIEIQLKQLTKFGNLAEQNIFFLY